MKQQVTKSDYVRLSDEELIHRYVQRQDRNSISILFERYGHLVFGVCLTHFKSAAAAKEATQGIFIKLMEDLFKYKIEQFKPWFFQFIRTYCQSQLRGALHTKAEQTDDLWAEEDRTLQEKLELAQLTGHIEPAVAQLVKEQKVCVELFYDQKLTYTEIAKKTKYPVKDIKGFLQNGKRSLRNKLYTIAEVRK